VKLSKQGMEKWGMEGARTISRKSVRTRKVHLGAGLISEATCAM